MKTVAYAMMLLGLSVPLLGGEPIECDLGSLPGIVIRRKEFGQSAKPAKIDDKKALRVDFNCAETQWAEFTAPVKQKLSGSKIKIAVELFIPEKNKAKRLSIRLVDAAGEVHQFSRMLPNDVSGWTTIAFDIDTTQPNKDSWKLTEKAVVDQKLDLPLRFSGFAFNYLTQEGTGWLGFGKFTITEE